MMRHPLVLIVLLTACGEPQKGKDPLLPLPPLDELVTTLEAVIVPSHEVVMEDRNPAVRVDREELLAEGFGAFTMGAGEPYLSRDDGPDVAPAAACDAGERLVRLVHLADIQLTDDESPLRLAAADARGPTQSAFRPQESHGCRMLDAMVRTINAVPEVDFVLLGGDNIDNAQENELDWLLTVLAGQRAHCDSGADDDPVSGPSNDVKDPFMPVGLATPWWWVTGNHDVLNQGNFPVTEARRATAVGSNAQLGTRDWSKKGGPVVTGEVTADPERVLLYPAELHARLTEFGPPGGAKANYSFDVPGTKLRFIVIDTAAATGGAGGILLQGDVTGQLQPMLDQALADERWVILASHHAIWSLGDGDGTGGDFQPDYFPASSWVELLGDYPNIVASLVGHSHRHVVHWQSTTAGGFWEIISASLADWPQQARIVEVFLGDDANLCIRTTALDYATDGDPMALEGRTLSLLDVTSAWNDNGTGTVSDRNLELWIPAPAF